MTRPLLVDELRQTCASPRAPFTARSLFRFLLCDQMFVLACSVFKYSLTFFVILLYLIAVFVVFLYCGNLYFFLQSAAFFVSSSVWYIFIGPESDHCLLLSLTDSCLVDLIEVNLACKTPTQNLLILLLLLMLTLRNVLTTV